MMTLRQRVLLIGGGVLLILGGILWYLLSKQSVGPTTTNPNVSDNPEVVVPANSDPVITGEKTVSKPVIVLPAYSEDIYVRQLAKIFVERFGSYSNQNNNKHITDSLPLATETMQKWMRLQAKPGDRNYEGVVTEVLAGAVVEKTAGAATVAIQIQQTWESKTATSTTATVKKIEQRKGTVKLVKISDQWKIDALYWQ